MKEAQEMMNNPEFIKQMKELQKSKEYNDAMKKTKEMLSDPTKAAHAEAKLEHMAKIGQEQIQKNAATAMEEAMKAMYSDPAVMQEMMKMVSDPSFKETFGAMAKDSQMKEYMDAMKVMMQDPSKKKIMDEISSNFKAKLS